MKSNTFLAMLIVLTSLLSTLSLAKADEQNVFFGVNYSIQVYSNDTLDSTYTPTVALMRLGVDVVDAFGFEARYGFSVTADSQTESNNTVELTNTAMMGLYAKPRFMITSTAGIYGLVGVTSYDLNLQSNKTLVSHFKKDSSSVSLGLGLESRIKKTFLLNAEFVMYSIKSDEVLSGIELGGAFLF